MGSAAGGIACLMALVGCSTSDPPDECAQPTGSYQLSVMPTGQSENQVGQCLATAAPRMVEIDLTAGTVSLAGENCTLCSTSGCQMNIVCGQKVDCSGVTTPVTNPPDTFVQNASFALPMQVDAGTTNVLVELGPMFCGYEGTAIRTD
jgi:hypothetical protein